MLKSHLFALSCSIRLSCENVHIIIMSLSGGVYSSFRNFTRLPYFIIQSWMNALGGWKQEATFYNLVYFLWNSEAQYVLFAMSIILQVH